MHPIHFFLQLYIINNVATFEIYLKIAMYYNVTFSNI
jgi:hypothetical protein